MACRFDIAITVAMVLRWLCAGIL